MPTQAHSYFFNIHRAKLYTACLLSRPYLDFVGQWVASHRTVLEQNWCTQALNHCNYSFFIFIYFNLVVLWNKASGNYGKLVNPCCRHVLSYIVSSTTTEPNCDLQYNYADWTLLTVFGRECIIWHNHQFKRSSMLMMTCELLLG